MAGLKVATRSRRDGVRTRARGRLAALPWPAAAALAAVVTALCGLIPPVALAVVGWVEAPDVGFWTVVVLGLRGWLLGHGAAATTAGLTISLVPLGVTALALLTGSGLAGYAARRARVEADLELSQRERRRLSLLVAGTFTVAYVVCILVACAIADVGDQTGPALLGGVLVGAVAGLVGAGRTLDWHPAQAWPRWAVAVPRAVGAALAVMVGTGSLVALIALATHPSQVRALHDSLQPGVAGGIVLVALQLVWLPNLVIWCGAWALGAGFRVGQGTLVSPSYNLTGMLPDIPVLGAIGPNGPGRWFALLWLLSGVLAGVIAAVVIVRSLRVLTTQVRFDESALVGGLSGVLAGLAFLLLAAISNGSLGTGRLSEVGARLAPLSVMAPVLMGLSGLAAGLVLGLLERRRAAGSSDLGGTSEGPVAQGDRPVDDDPSVDPA